MHKLPLDLRFGAALALLGAAVLALGSGEPSAASEPTCTKYASTSGSNSNPGTLREPYRTIAYLLGRVHAGETGCLLPGTFTENVRISAGGTPGSPLTLKSGFGVRATIMGTLDITDTANDVVISDLVLNGKNASWHASPVVNGDRVRLVRNEITNGHTAICVLLGPGFEHTPERALDPVVEDNRIHDCGRLPATGHDHGIYVEGTTNARIVNNVIYDNADYGIHLYPDGDGSFIANNVIDGNGGGLIFAGERAGGEYQFAHSSDSNTVKGNIVSNNTGRNNLESWWGGPTGTGNIVSGNCFWNGRPRDIDDSGGGFIHIDDTIADPLYVDRANKEFTLRLVSPCRGKGPIDPQPTPPPRPMGAQIAISPRTLVATRRGLLSVRLTNATLEGGTVRGVLTLHAVVARRRIRLGRAEFALPPARARAVAIRLSPQGLRALRRLRRMRAYTTAAGRDATGAARRGSRVLALRGSR